MEPIVQCALATIFWDPLPSLMWQHITSQTSKKNVYVYIKYAQTVFLDVRFRVCEENYLPKNFHLLLHVLASHIEHICGFFFQTKALNREVKVKVFETKYSGPKIAHQYLAPIENQWL